MVDLPECTLMEYRRPREKIPSAVEQHLLEVAVQVWKIWGLQMRALEEGVLIVAQVVVDQGKVRSLAE